MGRPRKPMNVAALSGAVRKNPQRYRDRVEPVGNPDVGPPPPEFLRPESPTAIRLLEIWNRFINEAPPGCITGSDRTRLANACRLQVEIERGNASTSQHAMMDRYLAGFGMSGAGRAQRGVRGKKDPEAESYDAHGWAAFSRKPKEARLN